MNSDPLSVDASSRRKGKASVARLGRTDRTPLGTWFWEIDRVLLLALLILVAIGLLAVAAASPATAYRYSSGSFHMAPLYYFSRQIVWIILGLGLMLGISMMPKDRVRRLSIRAAFLFLGLVALVPLIGIEANGSRRWIGVGFAQFQPSEFLKPLFVVLLAWILSLRSRDPRLPVGLITGGMVALVAVLLMAQPDFGQTVVFGLIWALLLLVWGVRYSYLVGMGGATIGLVVSAYYFYSVAHERINKFLYDQGDTYQTDMAQATLINGGLLGTGSGAGTMKFNLPEAHTDYIFSVIGEEFGVIACLLVAVVYLFIMVRVCLRLLDEKDEFVLLASAGLVGEFGLQALINMAVNVHLVPSKGMTLPFISYGGSSILALSIGMGLLLAFTRSNPYLNQSPYVVKWSDR